MAEEKPTWAQFESLILDRYGRNFWIIDNVMLDYGRVMIVDPADGESSLCQFDIDKADSFEQVLKDMQTIGEKRGVTVGVTFSSSCSGDIAGFKNFLSDAGFIADTPIERLVKDMTKGGGQTFETQVVVEQTQDIDTYATVMRHGFPETAVKLFKEGAKKNIDDTSRKYFLAFTPDSTTPVGSGATCVGDGLGYLSDLAVDPNRRRQGIGTALVAAGFEYLQSLDVRYVMTSVLADNTASLQLQFACGYEPFETTRCWLPPNSPR